MLHRLYAQIARKQAETSSEIACAPDKILKVRSLAKRMSDSKLLAGSEHLRLLLAYLIDKELSGDGERLKAYSIGLDVLGQSDQFNPATNSIVRVHMHRLREAVEHFYATNPEEPRLIQFNPGSYRPLISLDLPFEERNRILRSLKPFRYIFLFTIMSIIIISAFMWRKEKIDLVYHTSFFPLIGLDISEAEESLEEKISIRIANDDLVGLSYGGIHDYILSINSSGKMLYASIIRSSNNKVIFKRSYENSKSGLQDLLMDVQGDVVLGYRSILARDYISNVSISPKRRHNFNCYLMIKRATELLKSLDYEYKSITRCAENARISLHEDRAMFDLAWAILLMQKVRGYHKDLELQPSKEYIHNMIAEADEMIGNRAPLMTVKLYFLETFGYGELNDYQDTLQQAKYLYPEDVVIKGMISRIYGIQLGDWDKAMEYFPIDAARAVEISRKNNLMVIPLARAIEQGDYREALRFLPSVNSEILPGSILAWVVACKTGTRKFAGKRPSVQEMKRQRFNLALTRKIEESLEKCH